MVQPICMYKSCLVFTHFGPIKFLRANVLVHFAGI